MTSELYILANICTLLDQSFEAEELRRIFLDEDLFRDLMADLPARASRREVANMLVDFAYRQGRIEDLLAWAKARNPRAYKKYGPYRREPPGPDYRVELVPETVLIPHSPFLMGSDAIGVPDYEKPKHEVVLADYWIGVYPITNAQYAEFVLHKNHRVALEAGWEGLVPPREKYDHPMVGVSWYDALAYCDWLKEQTGRPYTLPSEAQWEKAARGTDGRIYPWGDTWEPDRCNHRFGEIVKMNAYQPQSVYGCYDMVGNAREWTSSLWGRKEIAPEYGYPWQDHEAVRDNLSASRNMHRVYRGGAALDESQLRCSARNGCDPKITGYPMRRMGFRVAWNP